MPPPKLQGFRKVLAWHKEGGLRLKLHTILSTLHFTISWKVISFGRYVRIDKGAKVILISCA